MYICLIPVVLLVIVSYFSNATVLEYTFTLLFASTGHFTLLNEKQHINYFFRPLKIIQIQQSDTEDSLFESLAKLFIAYATRHEDSQVEIAGLGDHIPKGMG